MDPERQPQMQGDNTLLGKKDKSHPHEGAHHPPILPFSKYLQAISKCHVLCTAVAMAVHDSAQK